MNTTNAYLKKMKIAKYLQKIFLLLKTGNTIKFANKPINLTIKKPINLANSERIFIGDNVNFGRGCTLYAITNYPTQKMSSSKYKQKIQIFNPLLKIGNNVTATSNVMISAVKEIIIEDDVMLASNIFIGDHQHGYDNPYIPYKYQPIFRIEPIKIKKGCWIGNNCIIMPGVTIGKYSIIGANSVVTYSIPDQSIAYGSPAKVIKRWDEMKKKWMVK